MGSEFFRQNRDKLTTKLRGGVVVISAFGEMQRSVDESYRFEQDSYFWYLSGIDQPDWQLIIDGSRHKSWLVRPAVSQSYEIFNGSLDEQAAQTISGVEAVIDSQKADELLRQLATQHSLVYTLGQSPHAQYLEFQLNNAPKQLTKQLERTFERVQDCRQAIDELRAIKQPQEIRHLEQAIDLTAQAFEKVKQSITGFRHEYEIEAEFSYYFRRHGAIGHAYDPIVAAGKNACTLHYTANQDRLKKPQLILMDIGARLHGYAADITRTYAYGTPTKRQKAFHAAVRTAHQQIIALLRPGLVVGEYLRQVDDIMKQQLIALGLVDQSADTQKIRQFFPHAISHGLGVDVHDSLARPQTFQPGMVLTVEPGIYSHDEAIGVRIEDDILITDEGHRNLSSQLSTEM